MRVCYISEMWKGKGEVHDACGIYATACSWSLFYYVCVLIAFYADEHATHRHHQEVSF